MFRRASTNRLSAALLSTVVLSAVGLISSPSAVARWGGNEPCVAPNGMTLKQQYGYSVAVIASGCTQIPAGERWGASVPWIMDARFEQMPSGFATDRSTPIDDFRGKLQSIEYVVDPGSPYRSNRSFPGEDKLWVGQLPDAAGLPAINTVSLGSLDPLPVGQHTAEVYWNLKAPHCDGFTADQGTSCLPAGKTLVKRIAFKVVAPAIAPAQSG